MPSARTNSSPRSRLAPHKWERQPLQALSLLQKASAASQACETPAHTTTNHAGTPHEASAHTAAHKGTFTAAGILRDKPQQACETPATLKLYK
eukprot:587087-Pelagomonas_calceolata.AAC.2